MSYWIYPQKSWYMSSICMSLVSCCFTCLTQNVLIYKEFIHFFSYKTKKKVKVVYRFIFYPAFCLIKMTKVWILYKRQFGVPKVYFVYLGWVLNWKFYYHIYKGHYIVDIYVVQVYWREFDYFYGRQNKLLCWNSNILQATLWTQHFMAWLKL